MNSVIRSALIAGIAAFVIGTLCYWLLADKTLPNAVGIGAGIGLLTAVITAVITLVISGVVGRKAVDRH